MKEKEITIYDIAEKLKLSPATISRSLKNHPAISKKTKKQVLETAKQLGYRSNTFASNLRRQKTNTLGVIVPRLNSSFMSDVLAGMERKANDSGYNLIITQSLETEKKEIINAATMFHNRVDGLIVSLSYETKNYQHFEPFLEKEIPVLFFDRVINLDKCSTITIDNYKASYELTEHLINQGCKNIMYVSGNLSRNVYNDRFTGFKKALTDHHLSFADKYLMINNLTPENGIETAETILKQAKLPDGVIISNDLCAAHIINTLKSKLVNIPNDIAIAGFNNDPISKLIEPSLTTVDYKGFDMGEMAVKTMIQQLEHKNTTVSQSIVMKHELIIRESSIKQKK